MYIMLNNISTTTPYFHGQRGKRVVFSSDVRRHVDKLNILRRRVNAYY